MRVLGSVIPVEHGMLLGYCNADRYTCSWGIKASDSDYVHTWIRNHLRTEHADLFERCEECDGRGTDMAEWMVYATGPVDPTCRLCNGRGWTWKED